MVQEKLTSHHVADNLIITNQCASSPAGWRARLCCKRPLWTSQPCDRPTDVTWSWTECPRGILGNEGTRVHTFELWASLMQHDTVLMRQLITWVWVREGQVADAGFLTTNHKQNVINNLESIDSLSVYKVKRQWRWLGSKITSFSVSFTSWG